MSETSNTPKILVVEAHPSHGKIYKINASHHGLEAVILDHAGMEPSRVAERMRGQALRTAIIAGQYNGGTACDVLKALSSDPSWQIVVGSSDDEILDEVRRKFPSVPARSKDNFEQIVLEARAAVRRSTVMA